MGVPVFLPCLSTCLPIGKKQDFHLVLHKQQVSEGVLILPSVGMKVTLIGADYPPLTGILGQ